MTAADCPQCDNTVEAPIQELVDEQQVLEARLYACPECGNTWEEEV